MNDCLNSHSSIYPYQNTVCKKGRWGERVTEKQGFYADKMSSAPFTCDRREHFYELFLTFIRTVSSRQTEKIEQPVACRNPFGQQVAPNAL